MGGGVLWKLTIEGKWSPCLSAPRVLASMLNPLQSRIVITQQPYDGFVRVPILQTGTERKAAVGRSQESSSKIRARACPPRASGGLNSSPESSAGSPPVPTQAVRRSPGLVGCECPSHPSEDTEPRRGR